MTLASLCQRTHTLNTTQHKIRFMTLYLQNQETKVMNAINTYLNDCHVKLRGIIKAKANINNIYQT